MEFTVGEVMEIEYFKFSFILNGDIGMNNRVSCITIMDIPHITCWLRGYELLISGINLEESFTREFIDGLLRLHCAGIVTKGKYTSRLDDKLVEYCTLKELPIIIAPDQCSWGDMMNPVNNAIIKKQYKSIEDTNRFHNILIQSIVKDNTLIKLCDSMIRAIDLPCAILTASCSLLAATDQLPWEELIIKTDIPRKPVEPIARTTGEDVVNGVIVPLNQQKIFIYPVRESRTLYGYICVCPDRNTLLLSSEEIIKIQFSGLILALKVSQQMELENSTKYYRSLILNELLHASEIDRLDIPKYHAALGKTIREQYRIIILQSSQLYSPFLTSMKTRLENRNMAWEEWLIFEYDQKIIIFLPVLSNITHERIVEEIISITAGCFYCGAGSECPFSESRQGYKEALQALQYAIQNDIKNKCVFYKDLGIIRLLTDNNGNLNTLFINEMLAKYILPLQNYDRTHHSQLFFTIQTYIANHCSSLRTCEKLFIHKNTLRARIKTIEKLIGAQLTGDELFHMQLGLKIFEYSSVNTRTT